MTPLRCGLATLSPRQAAVAVLYGIVGLSEKRIAARLGCSDRNVRHHVTTIVALWDLDPELNYRVQVGACLALLSAAPSLRLVLDDQDTWGDAEGAGQLLEHGEVNRARPPVL